jgi:hypothetical protein
MAVKIKMDEIYVQHYVFEKKMWSSGLVFAFPLMYDVASSAVKYFVKSEV